MTGRPVRILYLADRLSVRGGADLHLLDVIRWAAERGHRVTVACGRREAGAVPPPGVEVVTVRGLAAAVASGARLGGLDALLDRAELVHVQNVMNPVALRAAAATGRAVVTVQDHRLFCPGPGRTLPGGAPCRELPADGTCAACLADAAYRERMLALTAARLKAVRGARLVVLSRYMARELAAAGHPGAAVVPPVVEAVPERRRDAGRAFLLGGRLVRHKAPLDGVRAWELAGRPLPLRVAGEGPLAAALGGVEHLGWLDREALRRELGRARALLFPARWQEPFGILGVEALGVGTPVIVADSGGTEEWSGAGCLRVAAGDVAAMAEAVRRLAADPGLALELGEAGRRLVAERFAPAAVWPRLEAVYREVLSGSPGRGSSPASQAPGTTASVPDGSPGRA